jgi:outer membrane lipoprotein-sorting protein
MFFLPACHVWRNSETKPVQVAADRESVIPFSIIEPEAYQADVIITSGGASEAGFIARSGNRRRVDYIRGENKRSSIVDSDGEFYISYPGKVYAEAVPSAGEQRSTAADAIAGDILYHKNYAEFEDLGPAGNGVTRYSVTLGDDAASKAVISIDDATSLPIKQEFYSLVAGDAVLRYSVELRNVRLDADDGLFAVPQGFRKVSLKEFAQAEGR